MISLANGILLPNGAVVQSIESYLGNTGGSPPVIERIQYDKTLPIIEARLIGEGTAYTVPSGAAVSIRLQKPDGTVVYNPALGLSTDFTKAYITITQQMTIVPGDCKAVIEVANGEGVICSSMLTLKIIRNPIQEGVIESKDEFKTLTEILAQVQDLHKDVETWHTETEAYKDAAETSATAAENSAASATSSASSAQTSATQAAAAQSNAAQSAEQAQAASEHYPTISTDGYWQLWNVVTGQYEKTTQLAQGPKGEQGEQGPPVDTSTLIAQSEKGQPNGIATLNGEGKLEQMPTAADVGVPVETGTWTPELTSYSGSTQPTVTYETPPIGYYWQIGNIVMATCRIQGRITSAGDGFAQLGGLPLATSFNIRFFPVIVGELALLLNAAGIAYLDPVDMAIKFRDGLTGQSASAFVVTSGNYNFSVNLTAIYPLA